MPIAELDRLFSELKLNTKVKPDMIPDISKMERYFKSGIKSCWMVLTAYEAISV